jgi:hypothetical protein
MVFKGHYFVVIKLEQIERKILNRPIAIFVNSA